MTEMVCAYAGNRDDTLIAYLYDDIAPAERVAFDAHLAACAVCREELAGFTNVRSRLATWVPPEPVRALMQPAAKPPARGTRIWAVLHEVPVWAQLAAAVLVLGVSAGAANLNIKYNADGLSIRTGWSARPSEVPAVAASTSAMAVAPTPPAPSVSKDDLVDLEQRLKTAIAAASSDTLTVQRARALIADSEKRQQSELALRIAGVSQENRSQREVDRISLSRVVAAFQNSTRSELTRTRNDTDRNSRLIAGMVGKSQ